MWDIWPFNRNKKKKTPYVPIQKPYISNGISYSSRCNDIDTTMFIDTSEHLRHYHHETGGGGDFGGAGSSGSWDSSDSSSSDSSSDSGSDSGSDSSSSSND